jgi:ribokinase
MTIYNLGSINADFFYAVPWLPAPGETLAARSVTRGLGGKGANMSVAAARAAARVVHVGAVGPDGRWAVQRLMEYGVDTRHIAEVSEVTGHAIIAVAEDGENSILIWPGANRALPDEVLDAALAEARPGDWALCQNETEKQASWAKTGSKSGLLVAYAAAPFDAGAVQAVLPFLDLLVLNAVEAEQLRQATGQSAEALGVRDVVVTRGAEGCTWHGAEGARHFPALPAKMVDSTGAGDTFTGYLLAGLDRGMPMAQAIGLAQQAAALMVTRRGTADVIPDLREVQQARGF